MDAGLGKDLNLAVIAALLSVAVAIPTALITSRVNLGNEREQERRAREREAIAELERAILVLEPYAGRSRHRHHGRRVVAGQRLLQTASDIFLGWTGDGAAHYYVRQLWT